MPGIYAAGDVTGVFQLASVAAMQGRIAMWHALGEAVAPIKLKTVAANVFTHPEIATVGVQEKSITDDQDIDVVRLPLATNARAKMSDLRDGFVKLFTRRSTGVVIGGVVVAPGRLGADPADRARRHQGADRRRPGADVRDLPVAVGLDHRGRPPADGRRRALLTGTAGGRGGRCGGCDGRSAQLRRSGADARGHRRCRRGCLLSGSPPPPTLLRSLAVAVRRCSPAPCCPAGAAARRRAGRHDGRRPAGAGVARGRRTRRAGEADGPISWVQNADGDAVRIPTDDVDGIPAGSTVQVTVGAAGRTATAADPLHQVIDAEVVAPAPVDPVLRDPAGLTNQVTVVRVAPDGAARDGVTAQQLVDARRRPGRRTSGPSRATAPSPSASPPSATGSPPPPAARTRPRCGTRSPRRSASSPARAST